MSVSPTNIKRTKTQQFDAAYFQQNKDINKEKNVYIYAQIDIDKLYAEIVLKSKRIKQFLQQHHLENQFTQKMRLYKNFRIVFDAEAQKFIHKKELAADLRVIKKNVFNSLQQFVIKRYQLILQQERLRNQYQSKVSEIQNRFIERMKELSKGISQQ